MLDKLKRNVAITTVIIVIFFILSLVNVTSIFKLKGYGAEKFYGFVTFILSAIMFALLIYIFYRFYQFGKQLDLMKKNIRKKITNLTDKMD